MLQVQKNLERLRNAVRKPNSRVLFPAMRLGSAGRFIGPTAILATLERTAVTQLWAYSKEFANAAKHGELEQPATAQRLLACLKQKVGVAGRRTCGCGCMHARSTFKQVFFRLDWPCLHVLCHREVASVLCLSAVNIC